MTTATALTLSRLAAVPALVLLVVGNHRPFLALGLFGLAAATDWADGAIARRWNQTTAFGARLDALVDKIFILALILVLWKVGVFVWPVVALVVCRDLAVQLWRQRAPREHPIPANRWGKLKFLLQCVAVAAALLAIADVEPEVLRTAANIALVGAVLAGLPGVVAVWRVHTSREVETPA